MGAKVWISLWGSWSLRVEMGGVLIDISMQGLDQDLMSSLWFNWFRVLGFRV